MAADYEARANALISSPARSAIAVVPSDSTDLATPSRALYVGVSGDVKVTLVGDADNAPVTFKAAPVGILPVQAKRVWNGGTTATNILALS